MSSPKEPHLQAVQPVPVVTEDAHQFKNFHRLLCERFGYCHDEKDWRRDQVSLIEHIAALTEERDRLKQWQADQVEVNEEAKALITELNADKKALEAERDRMKDQRDYYKARDEEGERIQAEIEAERDRLAKANAELLRIGSGLANAAFNLSQDSRLTTREGYSLRKAAGEWDDFRARATLAEIGQRE